jgi:hypothetical protein
VQATVQHGKLIGVKTVVLTGDGPHTQALNARAEPLLRASALKAGSADVDAVSGATYTSRSWKKSLQARSTRPKGDEAAGADQWPARRARSAARRGLLERHTSAPSSSRASTGSPSTRTLVPGSTPRSSSSIASRPGGT